MTFRISGLSAQPFKHLYGLSDDELQKHGAKRYLADTSPGYPDRIEMRDAKVGESLLLLNHVSQNADSPYRASHAIFILEGATETYSAVDEVPQVMQNRLISLRAFDADGMILDADVATGGDVDTTIRRLFENPKVVSIHAHNAKQGCFSGLIERA